MQSALAAGFCLGLPAGLLLWLILFREVVPSAVIDGSVAFLQANGLNKIIVLTVCSLTWSFLLGRISGYRAWWKIGFATALGILAGWFSPLSNLDGWLPGAAGDELPVHTLYALAVCGIVSSVTLCVGLAYGFLLRSGKAALVLALTTSLASMLTVLLTILFFDQFGIRVGTGNFAMSRITAMSLLMSAITGGTVLGVGFSRFVEDENPTPDL